LPYGLVKHLDDEAHLFLLHKHVSHEMLSPPNCLLHGILRDMKSSCRYF